eukprot:scaffold184530_cov22-Tisochrysis_lutea.AAC.1
MTTTMASDSLWLGAMTHALEPPHVRESFWKGYVPPTSKAEGGGNVGCGGVGGGGGGWRRVEEEGGGGKWRRGGGWRRVEEGGGGSSLPRCV